MIGGINMVVAFTGYRPEKMPFVESKKDEAYLKFRKRQLQVIERLIERGCTHFQTLPHRFCRRVGEYNEQRYKIQQGYISRCRLSVPPQCFWYMSAGNSGCMHLCHYYHSLRIR